MVIDHPYGRDDCFLSTVPDIGNARHSAGGSQWRLANHRLCLFLERCCMGVVHQIKDLDNSSKPLPYKFTETFTVGEGLAPPERYVKNVILGEAYLCFRNATL